MRGEKISMGVDGVLAVTDWGVALVQTLEKWGVKSDTLRCYSDPVFLGELKPYLMGQMSVRLIQALGYEVELRAVRPTYCTEVTRGWVNKYYPGVKTYVCGYDEKIEMIKKSGALFHVDDHADTVAQINKTPEIPNGYLLTRPWNKYAEDPSRLKNGWFSVMAMALVRSR